MITSKLFKNFESQKELCKMYYEYKAQVHCAEIKRLRYQSTNKLAGKDPINILRDKTRGKHWLTVPQGRQVSWW